MFINYLRNFSEIGKGHAIVPVDMKSNKKHIRLTGWTIGIFLLTAALYNLYVAKRDVVEDYLSLSATLRESCNYAHIQNGVNQRTIDNPFKGR